jgi:hypothetical protein
MKPDFCSGAFSSSFLEMAFFRDCSGLFFSANAALAGAVSGFS